MTKRIYRFTKLQRLLYSVSFKRKLFRTEKSIYFFLSNFPHRDSAFLDDLGLSNLKLSIIMTIKFCNDLSKF